MKVIISLGISAFSAYWYGVDFSVLYSLISAALDLYSSWIDYTNDKHSDKIQK